MLELYVVTVVTVGETAEKKELNEESQINRYIYEFIKQNILLSYRQY